MDVASWLRSLGLEQYEPAFRDNAIDSAVLPDLTVDDLKDLGIVTVGHRRKILTAIHLLSGGAALPAQTVEIPPTIQPLDLPQAELRQLTVMFCDLVGSTTLAARLDPEDMGDVLRAFQGAVAAAARRFEGHVAKLMGDGTLVYFGYPVAHEDDPERAVRAGLAIVEAVGGISRPDGPLRTRVGIASGLVLVGELMGEGEARERGVVGDTPNLAARLQALASPGVVVVAPSTKELLVNVFDVNDLGPQDIKGFAQPVNAWAIVGEAENLSRFDAVRSGTMTPFVGREQEISLLVHRWRSATDGDGQIVLLSGEAGVGKSRVLTALRERIADEDHFTLHFQCSPYHMNEPFYPVIQHLQRAAKFTPGDTAAMRLDKLEAMIVRSGLPVESFAPQLAPFLSIDKERRYAELDIAGRELREQTVSRLLSWFLRLAKQAPILAILEDAHWVDPSSLDAFSRLIDRLRDVSALLVVTYRPEFVPPWTGRANLIVHGLDHLGRSTTVAMVDRLTGGRALPAPLLAEIVAKTDGVPLFVEELTKTVLESGALRREDDAYVLVSAMEDLTVPSTLRASLMARLDRLKSAKEIAQIGAAIGREFSYRLLAAVAPVSGEALNRALARLTASELIHRRGVPPDATYTFKHALVQETAYVSLLRSRRRRIHADIARALEAQVRDEIDASPAIVARHYAAAGLVEAAARSWLAAADLALSRSANAEADGYVEAALAVLPKLADEADRTSIEIQLQLMRAGALTFIQGHAATATIAALDRAKHLLDSGFGTDAQRLSMLYGLCSSNYIDARLETALGLARELAEMAARHDEGTYRLVGLRMIGMIQAAMGHLDDALESLEQAERCIDPSLRKTTSHEFGWAPRIAILSYKGWVLGALGLHDRAAQAASALKQEASHQKHSYTLAASRFLAVTAASSLRLFETSERESRDLVAFCTRYKVDEFRLQGAIYEACARAILQPSTERAEAIATARTAHRSGPHVSDSHVLAQLAEASLLAGDLQKAESTLESAFDFVERSGERHWLAELHRIAGRVELARPDAGRARDCFLRAVEVARRQGARMLELRAATDLARPRGPAALEAEAHARIGEILSGIEGGEDLPDVRDARALLAQAPG